VGRRTISCTAALALVAICGGGCGGGDQESSSAPSGPSAAKVCARIPATRVEGLVAHASSRAAPELRPSATGSAQLIKCAYKAKGVDVDLNLDLAANSRKRFDNRITEMTQFSTGRPATFPRPVRGVGDARSGNQGAQWVPALDQLLAYRPGRYLIVDFTAPGAPDTANRDGAATLARFAFPVLPRNPHAAAERPTPG
jgi:hypothetical protein